MWVCVLVVAAHGSLEKGEYSALLWYLAYVSILKLRTEMGRDQKV